MSERPNRGPQLDRLSQAIIRAILSSQEVKAEIARLQNRGDLDAEDILALALKFPSQGGLEARVELIRRASSESGEVEILEPETSDGEERPGRPFVNVSVPWSPYSHREMTPNERAFENYLQERFDVEAWMKEVGIRFMEEGEELPCPEGERQEKQSE